MNLPVEVLFALWVDEYRTGSGSDRVCNALSSRSLKARVHGDLSNGDVFIASPTQSLPLPVLYSSTHGELEFRPHNAFRLRIAGIILRENVRS